MLKKALSTPARSQARLDAPFPSFVLRVLARLGWAGCNNLFEYSGETETYKLAIANREKRCLEQ
jgi:hypothetical protein